MGNTLMLLPLCSAVCLCNFFLPYLWSSAITEDTTPCPLAPVPRVGVPQGKVLLYFCDNVGAHLWLLYIEAGGTVRRGETGWGPDKTYDPASSIWALPWACGGSKHPCFHGPLLGCLSCGLLACISASSFNSLLSAFCL